MPLIYNPGTSSGILLDTLIQEVLNVLHGYGLREQITSLSEDVTASATQLKVDDANEVSRGIIEIGDELIRVQSVDRASGQVVALPKGRGWRGTLARQHPAGSTVTMSPLVPRASIASALNDSIASLYPSVYGVATSSFTFNSPLAVSWSLPDTAEMILSVRYQDFDGNWQKVRRWELENQMPTTSFTTAKAIRIVDVPQGRTVQVVYGRVPSPLLSSSDTLESTGLPAGVRDVVVLGALTRLLPALDVVRLSLHSTSADELDTPIPPGTAMQLANELRKQFQARLDQERSVLQARFPAPVHFTR